MRLFALAALTCVSSVLAAGGCATDAEAASFLVSQLTGKYECHKYDAKGKNVSGVHTPFKVPVPPVCSGAPVLRCMRTRRSASFC